MVILTFPVLERQTTKLIRIVSKTRINRLQKEPRKQTPISKLRELCDIYFDLVSVVISMHCLCPKQYRTGEECCCFNNNGTMQAGLRSTMFYKVDFECLI